MHATFWNTAWDALAPVLFDATLKSLLLAGLAWAALTLGRVRDANVRHRVWTLVLGGMLALPAVAPLLPRAPSWLDFSPRFMASSTTAESAPTEVTVLRDDATDSVAQEFAAPALTLPAATEMHERSQPIPPQSSVTTNVPSAPSDVFTPNPAIGHVRTIPWRSIASAMYLATTAILLARVAFGIVLARKIVRRSRPLSVDDHDAFRAKNGSAPISESAEVRMPATAGIVRPAILLPNDWRSWPESSLRLVVAHERIHVARRDALTALAANVAIALYWFNPLCWLLRWQLAELAERVCDDEVLRTHGDRATYAETLLAMAGRLAGVSRMDSLFVAMARRAMVEERIEAIIDDTRRLTCRLGVRGAVVLLACAAPAISLIAALEFARSAPTPPAEAPAEAPAATADDSTQTQLNNARKIAGRVVIDASGAPLAKVEVRLVVWSENRTKFDVLKTTTDDDGRFAFEQLPAGTFRLMATHANLVSRTERNKGLEVSAGDEAIELRLKPAPALRVRVVDKATQTPIAGATVRLTWTDGDRDHETDANGVVVIRGLTRELWTFEVFAAGHAEGGEAIHLNDDALTDTNVQLEPGFELTGVVVDEASQPLAGVGISVFPADYRGGQIEYLTTDGKGAYRFPYLPRIGLSLNISKDDFETQRIEIAPTVEQGQTQTHDLTLKAKPDGGSVEGTIVDAAGKPVAGAAVFNGGMSSRDKRETTSDANGRYRLDNVFKRSQGYTFVVKSPGFAPGIVEFTPGTREAPAQVDVTLAKGHRVHGRVVDEKGSPVSGVYASYLGRYSYSSSDDGALDITGADGRYKFDTLGEDPKFEFRKSGYSNLEELALKLDGDDEVVVTLQSEAIVRGTVVDATTDAPIPSFVARVTFSPDRKADEPGHHLTGERATGEGEKFSSPKGEFRMGDFVRNMPLQVSIDADGFQRETLRRVVAVPETDAQPIEFRLKPVDKKGLLTLAGRVVNAAGEGTAGVELRLIASAKRRAFPRDEFPFNWQMIRTGQTGSNPEVKQFLVTTTDQTGRFSFAEVQPTVDIELAYWGPGVSQSRRTGLEKLTAAERQELRIEAIATGTVAGVISRARFPKIDDVRLSGSSDSFGAKLSENGGSYEVQNVPPGAYELQVYRRRPSNENQQGGYDTEVIHREPVVVKSGQTTFLNLRSVEKATALEGATDSHAAATTEAAVSATPAAVPKTPVAVDPNADVVIRGTVTTPEGSPVANAELVLPTSYDVDPWIAEAKSDDEGRFVLTIPADKLAAGATRPSWTLWSFHPQHRLVTISASRHLRRESADALKIVMAGPSDTEFIVTDPDNRPVIDALVEPLHFLGAAYEYIPPRLQAQMSVRTDANGRAKLPTIGREGFYSVRASASGFGQQTLRLVPREEQPALRPIALRRVGRIEGRLTADDPSLVANVKVYVGQRNELRGDSTTAESETTTDAEGRFEIPEFAEGRAQVSIRTKPDAILLPRLPDNVEVFAGERTTVEIPFERSVRIQGRVQTKPDGDAVEGALVSISFGGIHQQLRSDAEGNFAVNVLPGGVRQQLIMKPAAFENWTEESAAFQRPNETVAVGRQNFALAPIELIRTAARSGKLIGADGQPVVKMKIRAISKNRVYNTAMTDEEGAFEVRLPEGLKIDEYTVHGSRPDAEHIVATIVSEAPLVLQIGK